MKFAYLYQLVHRGGVRNIVLRTTRPVLHPADTGRDNLHLVCEFENNAAFKMHDSSYTEVSPEDFSALSGKWLEFEEPKVDDRVLEERKLGLGEALVALGYKRDQVRNYMDSDNSVLPLDGMIGQAIRYMGDPK